MREIVALRVLAIMGFLASTALIVGLLVLTERMDREQRRREITLVSSQVDTNLDIARDSVVTAATSDEAVRHLDHARDLDWASNAFVDPAGSNYWIYTFDHGGEMTSGRHASQAEVPFERALPRRIEAFRRAEGRRAVPARPAGSPAVSEVFWSSGRCFVFMASDFRPATGAIKLVHDIPPVLAAVMRLDLFLHDNLSGAGIRNLTIKPGKVAATAAKSLAGPDGRVVATLVWQAAQPGRKMLRIILPPLMLLISLFLILVTHTYRRGVAAARRLAASEERAHHLACHDQLTGLHNRHFFMEQFERRIATCRDAGTSCLVLLIDLDGFKSVNDVYGHQCGDELLCEAGRRLRSACRADDLCARLGGDEFIIAADICGGQEEDLLPRRILEVLSEPVQLTTTRMQVRGSVGASVFRNQVGAGELIAEADLALYKSKHNGRGQFCFFEPSINLTLAYRQRLKTDLDAALLAEEIEVHYQPQFDDGRVVGLEVLARWNHPEYGSIAPGYFIQLAEESGLIDRLGIQVVRRVFRDKRRWPTLRVAINLSAAQLRVPTFLSDLESAIREEAVTPADFEFELTESVLLNDDVSTNRAIARLQGLGFSLAMDDIGIGHCNLNYLRRFSIDRIKIDRSFIVGLPNDRVSEAVVRSLLQLGRTLGVDVVAGGVETPEQQRHLLAMGCGTLQGFLLARPGSADVIECLLVDLHVERSSPDPLRGSEAMAVEARTS